MWNLIFITLAHMLAYNCSEIYKNFRGASMTVRNLTGTTGMICYFVSIGLYIWSFWHYDWWLPIVAYIASVVLGGISALFFQKTLIGVMSAPFLAIFFTIKSIIGLIAM